MKNIASIVLAAGEGTRIQSKTKNKVMLEVRGKPMMEWSVSTLEDAGLTPIIVVVGFAKDGIRRHFKDRVVYALQKNQQGTAHAVETALLKLPEGIRNVLVINGDDSYNYSANLLTKLVKRHIESDADITMLTIILDNPKGLGRVIRNSKDKVKGVVEEKDATNKQRATSEINPQCWVFSVQFLKSYLAKVPKSSVTGEYYLTELIQLAVKDNKHIETVREKNLAWRGVNTKEELEKAQKLAQN